MKKYSRLAWPVAAAALALAGTAGAQSVQGNATPPAKEWSGYVGAGAVAYPKYVSGKGTQTNAAPLLLFEYKETVYVDLLRAGVRLWSSSDRKIALGIAAEPRFGFKAGDGARLTGMAERRLSVEAGPSFEWETPLASLNLAYFADVTGNSKGGSFRGSVYKQFVNTSQWDLGAYTGFDRVDSKVSNYYFGVTAAETTINRPLYQPGATTHWMAGISGAYKFSRPYALLFGVQGTRLGGAAANSPIAETRSATMGYVGFGWTL